MSDPKSIDAGAVGEVVAELRANSGEYAELIDVLRDPEKRKDLNLLLREGIDVAMEVRKDASVLIPAIQGATEVVKEGTSTSEFKMMSAITKLLTIIAIFAPVIEVGITLMEQHPEFGGSSLWVSSVSVILKSLIAVAYSNGRAKVKVAAAEAFGIALKK